METTETTQVSFTPEDYEIKSILYDLVLKTTNDTHLASLISSWKAELPSSTVLGLLKSATKEY